MKLTEWYPPDIKPVRIGVYETTSYDNTPSYQHWGGEFWGFCSTHVKSAAMHGASRSGLQDVSWRGIAK